MKLLIVLLGCLIPYLSPNN